MQVVCRQTCVAERVDCGQTWVTLPNSRQTRLFKGKIRQRFWQDTEAVENVPAGVRPRFHEGSADAVDAEPRHAGVCCPAGWSIAVNIREVWSGATM